MIAEISSQRRAFHKRLRSLNLRSCSSMIWNAWNAKALSNGPSGSFGNNCPHPIYEWELESIFNEYLRLKNYLDDRTHVSLTPPLAYFLQTRSSFYRLSRLEETLDLRNSSAVLSLQRTAWLQMPWLDGFFSKSNFARFWYIYVHDESREFFIRNHGIEIEKFILSGLLLFYEFVHHESIHALKEDLSAEDRRSRFKALEMLSSDYSILHDRVNQNKKSESPTIFNPSVLRESPLISIPSSDRVLYLCPLPPLIVNRITEGLFYYLVNDDNCRRVAGDKFEDFSHKILNHYWSSAMEVSREVEYNGAKSPDVWVRSSEHSLEIVVECKAKKIPFKLRASKSPSKEEAIASTYAELIKGIVQIWTFCDDAKRGVVPGVRNLSEKCVGVLLTLEPWFVFGEEVIDDIINQARQKLRSRGREAAIDIVPICFSSSSEIERILPRGDFHTVRELLHTAASGRSRSVPLRNAATAAGLDDIKASRYPIFDYDAFIVENLPWWKQGDDRIIPEV